MIHLNYHTQECNLLERKSAVQYMRDHMTNNKAMGLLAQAEFERWVTERNTIRPKYFGGCWIASPKGFTASRRFCFFTHPNVETEDTLETVIQKIVETRGCHTLFGSISRSGLGVTYCIPTGNDDTEINQLNWHMFRYENETLNEINAHSFFRVWPGSRGRASRGRPWQNHVEERYETLDEKLLECLVLNQAFYNSFIKGVFRKPLDDPYDTDAFIVSYSGKIFPLELKEKFPFTDRGNQKFGIDAGRILMLLRLCLPLDCNGMYIIREVEEDTRELVGWKIMTLDTLIMNSNWNLQAGGRGMLGGRTQTVTFQYEVFDDLKVETFSENNLHENSTFSTGVKRKATEFLAEVESVFTHARRQRGIV